MTEAAKHWLNRPQEPWIRFEKETDTQLDPFGRAVLAKLEPKPGERALDIGCGTGQTLLQLAELVGPEGHVLGVDISETMLGRARERVREAGVLQVSTELDNAELYAFSQRSFDLLFSRFGVMFFEDSVRAFRNFAGALRPRARLGFVCWQKREKNQWAQVLLDAVLPLMPTAELPPLLAPGRPGPFYFGDPDFARKILVEAGFDQVTLDPVEMPLHFGGAMTLEAAADYAMFIGPASLVIAEADPAFYPKFHAALTEALSPFVTERGCWLGGAVWLVSARRGGKSVV
ncbi:MAG TPA: class I SAM-dependent methyltransferase [Polyangiaceae bacterium]